MYERRRNSVPLCWSFCMGWFPFKISSHYACCCCEVQAMVGVRLDLLILAPPIWFFPMVGVQLDLLILAPPIGFFPMVGDWLLRFSFSGEQQLWSNFLRLFIVARWFVPFWRDTCRAKRVFFDGARPHSGLYILQFYISVILKVLCQNTKNMPTVGVGSGKMSE